MRSFPLSNRIEGLDTVRAVAALSVVFAHLLGPSMPGISRYIFTGHPAVIVFFVISGFCIHFPFRTAEMSAVAFLKRRYLRIVIPTAVALVLAQWVGIRAYNPIDGYILWSVVCELIYYSLYPLFLPVSRKVGWPAMIAVSVIVSYVTVIGLGSNEYGNAQIYGPSLNWVVSLPAWFMGCYIAQIYRRGLYFGNIWIWRAATAMTASILYWATMNTPIGFYLTMIPFGVLACGWILSEASNAERGKASAIMEKVGEACFSIYLTHVIAAAAMERLGITNPIIVCAGSLMLVVPFFFFVEKPAQELSRHLGRRMVTETPRSS
ncbi:acyltransferase family protein [Rhizobium laguerreae]|uniref:acyltransferase family protein n=1 Tax=Rhizobium laguerreae TaxID=1076926 RepID=UPI001C91E4CF|nr:acyltransferase [Rhizobium laguerreae]MBY3347202.1 acyltransferase [Rhizobium laguerreae]MBY3354164.1 acyltransferase [Rhizobium laguerreae]MBY3375209.1 acyltransferase [Rhizobium laguerreae]MBY3389414.1 acyltransferase [Rhizobium laguerreae]MBY3403165.1 acyltransferase [Rhizobium laguerreae]